MSRGGKCSIEGCENKSIAQKLCRKHYDELRSRGELPMLLASGRPRAKTSELRQDWQDLPEPARAEIQAKAKKKMMAILDDPDANQVEVLAILRMASSWEEKFVDETKRAELRKIFGGGEQA